MRPSLRPLALLLLVSSSACSEGEEASRPGLSGLPLSGDGLPPRTVVLTYDDGPDEHTRELAGYLHEQGVPATFFINGGRLCRVLGADGSCAVPQATRPCGDGRMQPPPAPAVPRLYPEALLDELLALGHALGNHSQDHCHLPGEVTGADLVWQLLATQEILDRHPCPRRTPFRAPYGEWGQEQADRVAASGALPGRLVGPVGWDVDAADWDCWRRGVTPEACTDAYLAVLEARPQRNGILLLHDRPSGNVGHPGPLLMARVLVPRLKAAGYLFASLDALLGGPAPTCSRW